MPLKIAIIGAGSIGFTRKMMHDILAVPELQDAQFAFHDINERNLDMVHRLCRRDLDAADLPATIMATMDRREALSEADYVFSFIRVAGLEGFTLDIEIPLEYGVDQCVGDTLGPGGIMYAQRTIPVLLDICRDIGEVGQPDCLFMNYSNPMAMNTWACTQYGKGARVLGLCHGVQHTHHMIADVLGVPQDELDVTAAGLNHLTWFIGVKHRGEGLTGKLLEAFEAHPDHSRTEKVRLDMLRRFGYFSTETNGHLSEYVPWYRKRPEEIERWIDLSNWTHGETGGYLRVCTEGRNWFEQEFPQWMEEPPQPFDPDKRSPEHGSHIIEALETGRAYRGHFNVPNRGCIVNLPPDCVVEVPAYVDGNGISVPVIGDLPLGPAAVCAANVIVQRLAVEAAVTGDDLLLRQAMMMDPLTGAVCDPPETWQMTDEMLVAQEQWLPQYADAIAAAKQRLGGGDLIPTKKGHRGAARLETKSAEQMARDRHASMPAD